MDEQKMRAYAMEACRRYSDDLAARRERVITEDTETKLKGVYRKPLTNEWQIHFNSWQVRYVPRPDASDEEHVEEIKRLMHACRELR
ncbi:MAG: hypothetical protein M3379_13970 [Acidobacteriota bacterium]|nr:hypothetical protein [Acidobacteriota bacterium]